jgi:hypothetical protein
VDLALPLVVLAGATAGLVLLVEPFPSWYFQFAWWSYVFAVDALNRRLSGRSLLRDDPRRFLRLAAWSVAWWTLFEAINLRLGNWYYVMDDPDRLTRWTGGVLAFATVLPGVLETAQLIGHLGWPSTVPTRPLRWSEGAEKGCLALGVASLGLPLAWPDVFFPLVWLALVFLIEPWNRRHARESFLRDLERGEAGPLCRTLLAGLVCGLLWETWNYWARTRWIYTVPGFETWKLLEMPLLGFLGFPPFAVECVALVRLLDTLAVRSRAAGGRRLLTETGCWLATVAGVVLVFAAADRVTSDSFYVPTAQLEILPGETRRRLASLGLHSPEKVLRALRHPDGVREWAARTGLPVADLERVRARVALLMHRGLGQDRARQLERLGITSLEDLARWRPEALAAALRQPGDRFLDRRVRGWLQTLPGPRRGGGTAPAPSGRAAVGVVASVSLASASRATDGRDANSGRRAGVRLDTHADELAEDPGDRFQVGRQDRASNLRGAAREGEERHELVRQMLVHRSAAPAEGEQLVHRVIGHSLRGQAAAPERREAGPPPYRQEHQGPRADGGPIFLEGDLRGHPGRPQPHERPLALPLRDRARQPGHGREPPDGGRPVHGRRAEPLEPSRRADPQLHLAATRRVPAPPTQDELRRDPDLRERG